MYLVPRKVLFDCAAHKKSINLSETETLGFKQFVAQANSKYKECKTKYADPSYAMDQFYDQMLQFLSQNRKNIKYVDSGSSRIVFAMADQTVMKLARNEKGIA